MRGCSCAGGCWIRSRGVECLGCWCRDQAGTSPPGSECRISLSGTPLMPMSMPPLPWGSRITGAVVLGSNPSLLLPSCVLRGHLVPACLTFFLSKMGTSGRQAKATCCGATSTVLCTKFSLQDISVSIFHESSGLDRVRDETLWKTGVLQCSSERGGVMTKCGSFLHSQ